LLLSLAGDDATHVQMQRGGADKFKTYHYPVTPELIARHMAGDAVLGTTLRHSGGKTRAVGYDADGPEGFQTLRDAACMLQAAGARPVLEDSPSTEHPGGGKLWVIFDRSVSGAAALATIEHHAPDLCGWGERWPSSARVRLPGARYRRNGVDAWCNVWSPGGVKLSGAEAFALLAERQTPPQWVTVAPPPPDPPRMRPSIAAGQEGPFYTTGAPIYEGDRETELGRVAGGMIARGASGQQLEALLLEANEQRCRPPLPDPDIIRLSRSIEATVRRHGGTYDA
jgi:hypothetical protein